MNAIDNNALSIGFVDVLQYNFQGIAKGYESLGINLELILPEGSVIHAL